jgi:hypothetical protein
VYTQTTWQEKEKKQRKFINKQPSKNQTKKQKKIIFSSFKLNIHKKKKKCLWKILIHIHQGASQNQPLSQINGIGDLGGLDHIDKHASKVTRRVSLDLSHKQLSELGSVRQVNLLQGWGE